MNKFMQLAINEARINIITGDGGPFGAVIEKNGKVVGIGRNTVIRDNDPTAHAEIMAIRDACRNLSSHDLKNCTLYASSYPCIMCMSASYWANIKEVFYSTSAQEAAQYGFKGHLLAKKFAVDLEIYPIKAVCIDNEDGLQLFHDWQKSGQISY